MRKSLLLILVLCWCAAAAFAGGYRTHRMKDGTVLGFQRHPKFDPDPVGALPKNPWDGNQTYRVPVILFSFADCDFTSEHSKQFYERLFNEPGFNLGNGPGCVADYYRSQSQGLFNVQFDIFGPVKLSSKQKSESGSNHGTAQFSEALEAADPLVNFADYVWAGETRVPTVIFIYAGYGGNEKAEVATGCIHPNTGYLSQRADGVQISCYSSSAELWSNNVSCGIGTICHEYCHTFGLLDFYPVYGDEYSVLDEWDLMDGGCFTDDGWCPPNLSIYEREQMKWAAPVDLTSSTHVAAMPSFDSSGLAYRIVNDDHLSEYYLLENRQQVGWDKMLPGHGLLVAHVDDMPNTWIYVNNDPSHHCYEYFHADGHDFNYYESVYGRKNVYAADGRSIRLQHSAYPYIDSLGVVHDALTDTTSPAATLFYPRNGRKLMGKPITQIQENDGLISFQFSDGPDAIAALPSDAVPVAIYDLQGNVLNSSNSLNSLNSLNSSSPRIFIIRFSDGTTKKCIR